jgi:hypothetical protein
VTSNVKVFSPSFKMIWLVLIAGVYPQSFYLKVSFELWRKVQGMITLASSSKGFVLKAREKR